MLFLSFCIWYSRADQPDRPTFRQLTPPTTTTTTATRTESNLSTIKISQFYFLLHFLFVVVVAFFLFTSSWATPDFSWFCFRQSNSRLALRSLCSTKCVPLSDDYYWNYRFCIRISLKNETIGLTCIARMKWSTSNHWTFIIFSMRKNLKHNSQPLNTVWPQLHSGKRQCDEIDQEICSRRTWTWFAVSLFLYLPLTQSSLLSVLMWTVFDRNTLCVTAAGTNLLRTLFVMIYWWY